MNVVHNQQRAGSLGRPAICEVKGTTQHPLSPTNYGGHGLNIRAGYDLDGYPPPTLSIISCLRLCTWIVARQQNLPDLGRKGEGNVWSLMSLDQLRQGATKALFARNPSSFASAWGGTVGLIWMTVYWVVLPLWPMYIAEQYQAY